MTNPIPLNQSPDPCGKKVDASTVPWNGPAISCLNICKGDSMQDVMVKEGNLLCQIVTELNTLQSTIDNSPIPSPPAIIDFSKLDLKCLYQSSTTTWTCPCTGGQVFLPDTSAPNGAGYCTIAGLVTFCTPVLVTTPNPIPPPTTLLGILQLILDKVPCCDPCAVKYCCDAPYFWLSPAATGSPTVYPNGACSQDGTAGTIIPTIPPFKC